MKVSFDLRVKTPWQTNIQLRSEYYQRLISDPEVQRQNTWDHNIPLLDEAQRSRYKLGLAKMSHCQQTQLVLGILDLQGRFDFKSPVMMSSTVNPIRRFTSWWLES